MEYKQKNNGYSSVTTTSSDQEESTNERQISNHVNLTSEDRRFIPADWLHQSDNEALETNLMQAL